MSVYERRDLLTVVDENNMITVKEKVQTVDYDVPDAALGTSVSLKTFDAFFFWYLLVFYYIFSYNIFPSLLFSSLT